MYTLDSLKNRAVLLEDESGDEHREIWIDVSDGFVDLHNDIGGHVEEDAGAARPIGGYVRIAFGVADDVSVFVNDEHKQIMAASNVDKSVRDNVSDLLEHYSEQLYCATSGMAGG